MKIKRCFAALSFFASLCSCADPEPALHATVYVRYLQAESRLRSEVTLYEGDTLQSVRPYAAPGGMAFLSSAMDLRQLPGNVVRYETERTVPLPPSLPLSFQTAGDARQQIDLPMEGIQSFTLRDSVLRKSAAITLSFEGAALDKSEKLILFFSGQQDKTVPLEIAGPLPSGEVTVAPDKLSSLPAGPASLYLVRTRTQQWQEGRMHWSLQSEFYTTEKRLNIMD